MRRLSFIVVVLAVCGIVAAACGGDEKGSTASTGEGDTQSGAPQIAFLAGVVDPGYTPSQVAGLEEGSGGKVTVFNPEFDPNKQLRQCQDAITTGRYDAIVITPLDSSSAIPCAQAAMNANIPLIVDQTAVGPDLNELEPQVDGVTASVIYRPATFAEYTWDMIEQACAGQADCEAVMEISFKEIPSSTRRSSTQEANQRAPTSRSSRSTSLSMTQPRRPQNSGIFSWLIRTRTS